MAPLRRTSMSQLSALSSGARVRARPCAQRCSSARAWRPNGTSKHSAVDSVALTMTSWLALLFPALAEASDKVDFGQGGNADPKSYYTVLALFLLSVPGVQRSTDAPRYRCWHRDRLRRHCMCRMSRTALCVCACCTAVLARTQRRCGGGLRLAARWRQLIDCRSLLRLTISRYRRSVLASEAGAQSKGQTQDV